MNGGQWKASPDCYACTGTPLPLERKPGKLDIPVQVQSKETGTCTVSGVGVDVGETCIK